MRTVYNYFSISQEYSDFSDIQFPVGTVVFHAQNVEERSTLFPEDFDFRDGLTSLSVVESENEMITTRSSSESLSYNLRSYEDAKRLSELYEDVSVVLDMTGLTHSAWAWIVRSMLKRVSGEFWVTYAEPIEYKLHENPYSGQMFDLSERILGIAPLPSFANLSNYNSDNSLFMPLLGFEGARLAHIFEDVQPSKRLTFPVFGVPGYSVDFPFFTYQGNKSTLEREGLWPNRRYEKANCPASIFILGEDLLSEYSDKKLRIALIGTKPHALGAVLLKLSYPDRVDLIYDHPIRKKNRTKGKSKVLLYNLTPFKEFIK